MKKLLLTISLLFPSALIFAEALPPPAQAPSTGAPTIDLDHCYQLALAQSESLAMIQEQVLQFEIQARLARAAILPNIDFIYTHSFQDTSGVDTGAGGVGGTLTRSERPEAKIAARQPLFAGFREFYAWSGFKALKRKEDLQLLSAKKLLYKEVALAYYSVLQLEADKENNRVILDLTMDRVKELEQRNRLGKSRPSELMSVQSQAATLAAQDEKIKGDLWVARDLLSFLTGKDMQTVALTDVLKTVEAPADEEAALARVDSITDLAVLKEDLNSRKYQIKYARGAFFPHVDISGNYYLKRVGFQEAIDWDALLTVDLPIFQGGENFARLRQAESEYRWGEWTYRRMRRQIASDIRRNFHQLRASIEQVRALEVAYSKGKESYDQQVKEYRYGLVNNLEVIQAMNTMQENKRELDRTAILNKLNYIELKVSTEELPLKP